MDKKGSTAVIMYLHKKGMKTKEIHDDMVKTHGEDSLCSSGWLILSGAGRSLMMTHGRDTENQQISHHRCPGERDSSYGDGW